MMKKGLYTGMTLTLGLSLFTGMPSIANAERVNAEIVTGDYQLYNDNLTDMTKLFSNLLMKNAAYMSQYALSEKQLTGTYPAATGLEFATKVKSGGAWDYKRVYKSNYRYNGLVINGEDLGNIHYGFVGRGAFFSRTLLSTAAGGYQIY